jgi:hypothetical protein
MTANEEDLKYCIQQFMIRADFILHTIISTMRKFQGKIPVL